MKKLYLLLISLSFYSFSQAQQIRAVLYNPTGADNGKEYFEIVHTPSTSLAGLTLLIIEGDGAGAGVLDKVIDLSPYSTGTNGLLLWRDAATVLTPAPSPATTLVVNDFSPDIENGTNTYLLVSGFTGTQGTDYDATNDGVLDSTPWTTVHSAVSVTDGAAADLMYANSVGGQNFSNSFGTPHGFVLSNGNYYAVRISNNPSGAFGVTNAWDSAGTANQPIQERILHPGNTVSPLPIKLKSFTGIYNNEAVVLNWNTAQEINNTGFEIQHSTNGKDFSKIDFVPTQAHSGNSSSDIKYSFTHAQYASGNNFYRLIQKDINGTEIYSDVINVRTDFTEGLNLVSLSPSPTMNVLALDVYVPKVSKVQLHIINSTGVAIYKETVELSSGVSTKTIDASAWAQGVYYLKMSANGQSVTRAFLKK